MDCIGSSFCRGFKSFYMGVQPMSAYTPDKWVVVEIKHEGETHHKILGSWYGGYLGSDSWRLNSGITGAKKVKKSWHVAGYSGSVYVCGKENYGMSSYTAGVLRGWQENRPDQGIRVLPENEGFKFLRNLA